jgi:hypothetical protein
LKTKVAEVGWFVVTGFRDGAPGTIEAITVAEVVGDQLGGGDRAMSGGH